MAGEGTSPDFRDFPPLPIPNQNSLQLKNSTDTTSNKSQIPSSDGNIFPSRSTYAATLANQKTHENNINEPLSLHAAKDSKIAMAFLNRQAQKEKHQTEVIPLVTFDLDIKNHLLSKVKHVLIAKFSHRRPFYKDFHSFLLSFNMVGGFNVSLLDNKHVFIEFEVFEDFVQVWMVKGCSIKRFPVRFFQWSDSFCPSIESSVAPVWVHLPGLPLHLLEEEALLKIALAIGGPLWIDPKNLSHKKVGFASICLALDVSCSHPEAVIIEFKNKDGTSEKFMQKLVYSSLPWYCMRCRHMGHRIMDCKQVAIARTNEPACQVNACYNSVEVVQVEAAGIENQQEALSVQQLPAPSVEKIAMVNQFGVLSEEQKHTKNITATNLSTTKDNSTGNTNSSKGEKSEVQGGCSRQSPKQIAGISGNTLEGELADGVLHQVVVQECSSEEEGYSTPALNTRACHKGNLVLTSSAGKENPEKPGLSAAAHAEESIPAPEIGVQKEDLRSTPAQLKLRNADDGSTNVNSCPPLLMKQNMEKFNRDSKAFSETKKTRILCKNNGLVDIQRRCYSDEEDDPNLQDDINHDPIVVAEGLKLRWSKMMESKAFIMHQRSVSPVGRASGTLKRLQYKIDLIEYPKESSMLYMNKEYEEEQRLKDTRKIQHVDEAGITPKKRGKSAKQQPKPTQATSKSFLLTDQAPRKRGRPKKK